MALSRFLPLALLAGLGLIPISHAADSPDARMTVEVLANPEEPGQSLKELHADVRHAAKLALTQLWDRIIPQQARADVPTGIRAVRFMQRAQPTPEGVRVSFNARRVLDYLETRKIPFIPEQPAWNLDIRMRNAAGQNMSQSAALISEFAALQAPTWGYTLSRMGDSLIMQWRWLDSRQVSLSVRGTTRLGEFQETRMLAPGDPLPQLQQWLQQTLIKARDANATGLIPAAIPNPVVAIPAGGANLDIYGNPLLVTDLYADPYAQPQPPVVVDDSILISIQRQASLPEQVLFEDDLKRDPRVELVLPSMLSHATQQYRLKLKDPQDNLWLNQWFAQHGLSLIQTADGWLAR